MSIAVEPVGNLAGVVLAAGRSTRLGEPKQLVKLLGKPLVCRAVETASAVCGAGVIVVTGDSADRVERVLAEYPVMVARNEHWESGLAGSIATGVKGLMGLSFDAVLVMLCDQPHVDKQDIARLAAVWQNAPTRPAAAAYGDRIGVPAIFPARYLDRLSSLEGDQGAQALLNEDQNASRLDMVSAGFDVDTPEDLEKLKDS